MNVAMGQLVNKSIREAVTREQILDVQHQISDSRFHFHQLPDYWSLITDSYFLVTPYVLRMVLEFG